MKIEKIIGICTSIILLFILFHLSLSFTDFDLDTNVATIYIEIINALIIIILTIQVYHYNKKKDELDFKTKTPLISISQEEYSSEYIIQNIGGGPALNVRILSDLDTENKFWKKNLIGYDLFGNNSFKLDYENKEQYLITYNDIYGDLYYSYMKNNHLQFGSLTSSNEKKVSNKIQKMLTYEKQVEDFSSRHTPSV
ncbi:hypothetical protein [Flavobacterium ustbae]|uniref:hypothetical protein n=1 Tax=Flavobacterium ustbae TaxID=2488790 RepID=UPI000F7A7BD6|nr:hypothetical protein [Flavobacterium ustbae]